MIPNYNPDVLTCLANLSNDEVFTPPALANQVLDMLPSSLWSDPNATFLDPVCKSGVFLREIAKRLINGLQVHFPDLIERLNHIYTKQLFGIAITELTSLLSRRSLYCSKFANGKYSVCNQFRDHKGNIIFKKVDHNWKNGRCTFCGANQSVYDRSDELESFAYQFIHSNNPEKLFKMKFDVIVGNPPYQLSDGGFGISATPIYHKFVLQAIKLNPRFLTMIIPARWYSGGKGMDDFRDTMLNDDRIRHLVDFPEAIDCFPGVQIKGGVCYFLWDRDNRGPCTVSTSKKGVITSTMTRPLLENGMETFIRYNEAVSIRNKVAERNERTMVERVSSRKPFGFDTTFQGKGSSFRGSVLVFQNGGTGYIRKNEITKNMQLIDRYKVLIPRAGSGSDTFPHTILGKPFVAAPNSVCTETYLVLDSFDNKEECLNLCAYVCTKFFRFMVLLMKSTQDASSKVYSFVPVLDMKKRWSDKELYQRYKLSQPEIDFIESMIRPMEWENE